MNTATLEHPLDIVPVDLGERSYEVRIGRGLLARAGEQITALAGKRRVAILTDETVAARHLPELQAALAAQGIAAPALALPAARRRNVGRGSARRSNGCWRRRSSARIW